MRAAKLALWLLCLAPLAGLAYRFATGGLGANPVEFITHRTGFWALVLLLATLAVTPLRRLTGQAWLIRLRRPLGLFAFGYALLHVAIWIGLDRFFDWRTMLEDLLERPYITAGAVSVLLMVPLAVTSTRAWTRRLGRRWQLLHRLVYPSAGAAVLHFFWKRSSKLDIFEPLLFAGILLALLLARVPIWLERRRRRGALPATPRGST